MALHSLCPEVTLPNPQADLKTAQRVEQYRFSRQAIYRKAFPGGCYLPFAAIDRAWAQDSALSLTGCCGKQLPVVVLRIRTRDGFYENFTFEKRASAERVLAALAQACPETPRTPEQEEPRG